MAKITQLSELDLNGTYTYADYLTWQFDEMVELIKGKIMVMSPAPNLRHQSISWTLNGLLFNYFRHKSCHAFSAPFDVSLYDRKKSILKNEESYTVVQPDLCVICNPEILDQHGCNGAPDWIIEIVSKSTAKKDIHAKYALYEESGVREYWLVFPSEQVVHQFVLNAETEKYQLIAMFANDEMISPTLFPDLQIDLTEVFSE